MAMKIAHYELWLNPLYGITLNLEYDMHECTIGLRSFDTWGQFDFDLEIGKITLGYRVEIDAEEGESRRFTNEDGGCVLELTIIVKTQFQIGFLILNPKWAPVYTPVKVQIVSEFCCKQED